MGRLPDAGMMHKGALLRVGGWTGGKFGRAVGWGVKRAGRPDDGEGAPHGWWIVELTISVELDGVGVFGEVDGDGVGAGSGRLEVERGVEGEVVGVVAEV